MYVSRHHPVSSTIPVSHSTISPKWTKKEDEKLKQAVQKYGTQWSFISKKYRFDRSLNSLVKRWHGKLKQEVQKGVINQSDQNQSQEEREQHSDKSKKEKKQQKREEKRNPRGRQQSNERISERRQIRQVSRFTKRQRQGQKDQKQNNLNKIRAIEQQSEKEIEENQNQEENEENNDSFEDSASNFDFSHIWKDFEDSMLKQMILNDKILNWEQLAAKLSIQNVKEIKKRWQKHVYPSIIESRKIGGCLKYSEEEDMILNRGVKLGMTIVELRKFLPGRTHYSLQARRRRTLKMDEQKVPQTRYWTKKINAYKFVLKRHQHLEKPTQEDEFLYRSESQ